MAETAADIKVSMDAIRDYIDRLYFTATFNSKTVGMLASNPGFPAWMRNNSQGWNHALGQYMGNVSNDPPHAYVSSQIGAPSFVEALSEGATSSNFYLAFEDRRPGDLGYLDTTGVALRSYSIVDTEYKFTYDLVVDGSTDNDDLMIGTFEAIDNVNVQPDGVHGEITKTVAANNFYRSLDYPPRHSFALGRMLYAAQGDTTKLGYFQDSEIETGFLKDFYHIFFSGLTSSYPQGYIYDKDTWKDTQITMDGDATTSVPNGLDSNGMYFYPHESKMRGKWLGSISGIDIWLSYIVPTFVYTRMVSAIQLLEKTRDPYHTFAFIYKPIIEIADSAVNQWITNIGMPGASDFLAGTPWTNQGSSFITCIFALFMTILGYGYGIPKYKPYADDAITVLRKAVWGTSPNNNDQKGYVWTGSSKTEWTRPDHKGGVLTVWKRDSADGKFYHPGKSAVADLAENIVSVVTSGLHQTEADPLVIPTNMEGSVLTWLAMRIYLAYAYGDDYPDGTWANGLNLLSGIASGKVLKDSDSSVIVGADVILSKGTQTANPQSLTSYVARTITDNDGAYALPFDVSGVHTIYVVKSGYKHMYKSYTIGAADQNLVFPDARMVTV